MSVRILRLRHRPSRDKRVTTHLILAARALGAQEVIYTGLKDNRLEESIWKIVDRWGGDFNLSHAANWKRVLKEWNGALIHLTMYGLPIQDKIEEIRCETRDKLVVVGGAKVPGKLFSLADWNIAVTGQPHSEVSALAIFLHMLYQGRELEAEYSGARQKIVPQAHGKLIENFKDTV